MTSEAPLLQRDKAMHLLLGLGLMAGALATTSLGRWFWALPFAALAVPVVRELWTGRGRVDMEGWRDIAATWIGSSFALWLFVFLWDVSSP